MCKLLTVSAATYNADINSIGDIVGVFEDTHKFSDNEISLFDVTSIPNLTRDEFLSALSTPHIQSVTDTGGNTVKMWRNPGSENWYRLDKEVKYLWSAAGISDTERAYLQSTDVSKEDKILALSAHGNNLSYQAENRVAKLTVTISVETDS